VSDRSEAHRRDRYNAVYALQSTTAAMATLAAATRAERTSRNVQDVFV
jgi:hypothetical protein